MGLCDKYVPLGDSVRLNGNEALRVNVVINCHILTGMSADDIRQLLSGVDNVSEVLNVSIGPLSVDVDITPGRDSVGAIRGSIVNAFWQYNATKFVPCPSIEVGTISSLVAQDCIPGGGASISLALVVVGLIAVFLILKEYREI